MPNQNLPTPHGTPKNESSDNDAAQRILPTLPPSVWCGLPGEYRDILKECTEAPEEFHLGGFLTAVGCLIGRRAYFLNPQPTFANFYSLLIGETASARKSTAYLFAVDLLKQASVLRSAKTKALYGLASIEGLAAAMGTGDNEEPFRVLCIEDEFKSLAAKGRQNSGSNIVPRLTELFNAPAAFEVNTKENARRLKEPFLCMLAASTQSWFEESVSQSEVSGGFLNRWLLFRGGSGTLIPFPKSVDQRRWEQLVGNVSDRVKQASGEFGFSESAEKIYTAFYSLVRRGNVEGLDASDATVRADLHAKKIALVYAVLAGNSTIEEADIQSGIDISIYCARIMEPIAAGLGRAPQAYLEDKIRRALQNGPISMRDLQRKLHTSSQILKIAVTSMCAIGTIRYGTGNTVELVP
jgi:hypothetical protein